MSKDKVDKDKITEVIKEREKIIKQNQTVKK